METSNLSPKSSDIRSKKLFCCLQQQSGTRLALSKLVYIIFLANQSTEVEEIKMVCPPIAGGGTIETESNSHLDAWPYSLRLLRT